MNKKINPKAVVAEEKTSPFIFFYPVMFLLSIIIYSINLKNLTNFLLLIVVSLVTFIPAFLSYYKKTIMITKKSIYVFLRGKEILKWSLVEDFYLIDVRQDKLGKFFGYGTLVLVNQEKKLYEFFFLANPNDFKDKLIISYEKLMKQLDPNYISSYILEKDINNNENIDVIEEKNEK